MSQHALEQNNKHIWLTKEEIVKKRWDRIVLGCIKSSCPEPTM